MSQKNYLKVPFVWESSNPLIEVPVRLKFKQIKNYNHEILIWALTQVMSSSLDAKDQNEILKYGASQAAEKFINSSKDNFSYQDEWWQFGSINNDNKPKIVGFVLPVVYQESAKDNLEEGTIYYIGVLPQYRGFGFAKELLLKGTQILQNVGVWRVFCDTDINNMPMISTFKRIGYRQYSQPWERHI